MAEKAFHCADCDSRYRVKAYDASKTYQCPKCGQGLKPSESQSPSQGASEPGDQRPANQLVISDPLVGKTLGHYLVLAKAGEGGMGAVYKAKHLDLERIVGLKVLSPEFAAKHPDAAARFKREGKAAAVLNHPNVVTVHAVDSQEGYHFLELEFVDGESLSDRLRREERLDAREATRIVADVARALHTAHRHHIVHRDIKPGNIMLTQQGVVKVMDFGLAKDVDAPTELTVSGQVLGTPYYMSPEQCRAEPPEGRSDIYSLGATYYHLLAGEPPYTGSSLFAMMQQHADDPVPDIRAKAAGVPARAQEVIETAMAKQPEDRYASAGEMAKALDAVLAELDAPAEPARPASEAKAQTPAKARSGSRKWIAVAASAIVAGGLAAWQFWPRGSDESAPDRPASKPAPRKREGQAKVAKAKAKAAPARAETPATPAEDEAGDEERAEETATNAPAEPPARSTKQASPPAGKTQDSTPPKPATPQPADAADSTGQRAKPAAPAPVTVEMLLRLEPVGAVVSVDGKRVELSDGGRAASLSVPPGPHTLKVSKEGHAGLEQTVDVPGGGLEAKVLLAQIVPHVVVHLKSGAKREYGLVSRIDDQITVTLGAGKGNMTLRPGQYVGIEEGEAKPAGQSRLKIVHQDASPLDRAIREKVIDALPAGSLADQVAVFVERWDANEDTYENARAAHGARSRQAREAKKRREALCLQRADLEHNAQDEIDRAKKLRADLLAKGRAKDDPVVRAAAGAERMPKELLQLLGDCRPQPPSRKHTRPRLPRELRKAFIIPRRTRDQYGNPVVRRVVRGRDAEARPPAGGRDRIVSPDARGDGHRVPASGGDPRGGGSRFDPNTGLPYEIWCAVGRGQQQQCMEFVLAAAGEFTMGGSRADEKPRHEVRIAKPFYIGKYEVTQGQWSAVMGSSPWSGKGHVKSDARNPAAYVSWYNCQGFVKKLGPAFRLPTEAQWEYACRAGSTSRFCFGDDTSMLKGYAWFDENTKNAGEPYGHGVGLKKPNAWGLYDMHGNVWEWCSSKYRPYPYKADDGREDMNDPGSARVVRGGSWYYRDYYCRSAYRYSRGPTVCYGYYGFRVVVSSARAPR